MPPVTAARTPTPLKTKGDVAERWGVSERTVQRLVDSGSLRAIKIGRQLRFTDEDIAAHERAQRT